MDRHGEKTLLQGIQDGDRAAFLALAREHGAGLRSYCRSILHDPALAEDVVQDVFLLLVSRPASLAGVKTLRPWLFRVARNRALEILGRRKREGPSESLDGVWSADDPCASLVERDLGEAVREGVARLKLIYREAIILREFEGMTYSEIAEAIGEPLSTVKFRIFKGREALVRLLRSVEKERRSS